MSFIPKRIATFFTTIFAAACLLADASHANAQPMDGSDLADVSLLSERDAIVPGETSWIAVHFAIEPEWHLYWKNAGDTGEPPTFKWDVPEGLSVGEAVWPAPKRYVSPGDILDYTFEGELVVLFPLEAERALVSAEKVTLSVKTDYLICKSMCLFGDGAASLTLLVRESASNSRSAPVFERTRKRIPSPPDESSSRSVTTSWDGNTLVVRAEDAEALTYYPDAGYGKPAALDMIESGVSEGDTIRIAYDGLDKAEAVQAVLEIEYKDDRAFQTLRVATPKKPSQ